MSRASLRPVVVAAALVAVVGVNVATAQVLPNPYRQVDGWASLPGGRTMGAVGGVTMDPDGEHLWAVIRCDATAPNRFGNECLDSDLDPVLKFNMEGSVVESFGGGMFIWPHGIHVDSEGNVWVTDAVAEGRTPDGTRGHQVIKFSSTGRVLMTLGTPGKPGVGNNSFNAPADVVVADNGDIFVADGHGDNTNNRIVKFSKDGTFIKSWGKTGYGPGEFRTLHAIAMDAEGRIYVGDRSNNRIQIFTEDGEFIEEWPDVSDPVGVFIDENDGVWVISARLNRILKYNLAGELQYYFGAFGGTRGGFAGGLSRPHQLDVDQEGNLYIASWDGGWMDKFVPRPGADTSKLIGRSLVLSN